MERILVAADGSEHSLRAADLAGRLSQCMQIPVVVVHVVPVGLLAAESPPAEYLRIEHMFMTQRDMLVAAGQTVVREAAARVRAAGGDVEAEDVLVGGLADEIVAAADARHCDCIVMGRRGLGNVGGLLMGSVSHKVGQLTGKTLITTE